MRRNQGPVALRDNRSMSGLKTALLMAALATLFIFIGGALGGQSGIVVAFIFAAVVNGISYWFSDRIVLKMHKAVEAVSYTHLTLPTILRV